MRLIYRYIAGRLIVSTALVLTVFVGLFLFFDLVTTLSHVGHEGLSRVFVILILGLPAKISMLFPMSALVGSTLGLSSLAIDGELTALRAAGVSVARIAYGALRAALVLGLVAALLGDLLGPRAASLARQEAAQAAGLGAADNAQGLWLKEGSSFVSIGEVLPDLSILRLTIYDFHRGRLGRELFAASGHYHHGRWLLRGVSQTLFHQHHLVVKTSATGSWSGIAPSLLSVFAVNPHTLSLVDLFEYIRHLQRNRQAAAHYKLVFWYKILAPFTTAAMVLLAVPFVFRHSRQGGLGFRLFSAVVLGLIFYVMNRGLGDLTLLYHWPAVLGAVTPTLILLLLSAWLLTRVG